MRYARALLVVGLFSLAAFALPPRQVGVWLAGDSTMAEKLPEKRPETGWGEMLQRFFDPARVRVHNHAKNGRSTRTFISEGRWQAMMDSVRPGDLVFIQFGHNDESVEKTDRYTPPADYRANLVRMISDVRARRGEPVLLTPVMRRKFDAQGQFRDTHGEYPDIVRAVAAERRVPLIDMHRGSERVLRQAGPDRSRRLFLQLEPGQNPNYPQGVHDDTHFNPAGADVMSRLAVDGIRERRLSIARYLLRAAPAALDTAR
ncbi:MAG: rhamnogalacturonan acetylesterase [Longimicrobiaceae bacterium]